MLPGESNATHTGTRALPLDAWQRLRAAVSRQLLPCGFGTPYLPAPPTDRPGRCVSVLLSHRQHRPGAPLTAPGSRSVSYDTPRCAPAQQPRQRVGAGRADRCGSPPARSAHGAGSPPARRPIALDRGACGAPFLSMSRAARLTPGGAGFDINRGATRTSTAGRARRALVFLRAPRKDPFPGATTPPGRPCSVSGRARMPDGAGPTDPWRARCGFAAAASAGSVLQLDEWNRTRA